MTRFVRSWLGLAATTATLVMGAGQAFAQRRSSSACNATAPGRRRMWALCCVLAIRTISP